MVSVDVEYHVYFYHRRLVTVKTHTAREALCGEVLVARRLACWPIPVGGLAVLILFEEQVAARPILLCLVFLDTGSSSL